MKKSVQAPAERLKFRLLVPVWGYDYIRPFLNYGLATLLAPGNLPALAKYGDVTLELLTTERDFGTFNGSPLIAKARAYADIQMTDVSDVIRQGSTQTVRLTWCYQKAFEATGDDCVDTNFIVLCSDYIYGDGVLGHLGLLASQGKRLVVNANFRVLEDQVVRQLDGAYRNPEDGSIAVGFRQLVGIALDNMHPVGRTLFWENGQRHNRIAFHFYWQVDGEGVLARPYLMHPLMVRPLHKLGGFPAFFDYGVAAAAGFKPGDEHAITNSDDMFLTELAPAGHEQFALADGANRIQPMARSIAEWANDFHRSYSRHKLRWHYADITETHWQENESRSDQVVDGLNQELAKYPTHPVFYHHYWMGALSVDRKMPAFHVAGEAATREAQKEAAAFYLRRKDPPIIDAWGGGHRRPGLEHILHSNHPMVKRLRRFFPAPPATALSHHRFFEFDGVGDHFSQLERLAPPAEATKDPGFMPPTVAFLGDRRYLPLVKERLKHFPHRLLVADLPNGRPWPHDPEVDEIRLRPDHPLPIGDQSCDAVVVVRLLERFPRPDVMLNEICRILKGGRQATIIWGVLVPDEAEVFERYRFLGAWWRDLAPGNTVIEHHAAIGGLGAVLATNITFALAKRLQRRFDRSKTWFALSAPFFIGATVVVNVLGRFIDRLGRNAPHKVELMHVMKLHNR